MWRLRKSAKYQRPLQALKWRLSPGVATTAIYFIGITMAAAVLLSLAHRTELAWAERAGIFCDDAAGTAPMNGEFSTSDMCWHVPRISVRAGDRYRLTLQVTEPWSDGSIVTSPEGIRRAIGWRGGCGYRRR